MGSLTRSARKRLKANPPPVKPSGKLYAGDVESVSILAHVFKPLDSDDFRTIDEVNQRQFAAATKRREVKPEG